MTWKEELNKQARYYHVLAGTILTIGFLSFTIADYYSQDWMFWLHITKIRFFIALLIIPFLWFTYKSKLYPNIVAYIYILSISIFIMYFHSAVAPQKSEGVITSLILFYIVSGFVVVWHWINTIILAFILIPTQLIIILRVVSFQEFMAHSGFWALISPIVVIGLVIYRYNFTKKEILLRLSLEAKNKQIEEQTRALLEQNIQINEQKNALIEQNLHIEEQRKKLFHVHAQMTDSVRYAMRIQQAILPKFTLLEQISPNYFIIYRAKDLISGDFYWVTNQEKYHFLAVADCTGHGVSGGFMSLLGHSLLTNCTK